MEHSLATELTRQLIQIESTDPGTYELTIKDWICSWLISALHADVRLYQDEVLPNRFNLMAELPGTDPGLPALVWICHMDTVVVGNGWTVPPFSALERDGKIYGRGACDMKSGLACCLSAFSYAAQKSISTPPRRTLKLICTVDEEDFMRGSERCIQSGWGTKEDWILDAEPTNGQIQVAHKGRTWYEITVTGHTAHASTPWKGADAVAAMAEIIHEIRTAIQNAPTHPDLGHIWADRGRLSSVCRSGSMQVVDRYAPCSATLYRTDQPDRPTGDRKHTNHCTRNPCFLQDHRKPPLCGKRRTFSIIKTFA